MIKYIDEKNTYIDEGVKIGDGTVIYPFVVIEGECEIGKNCVIGPNSYIKNSSMGDNCQVLSSHIFDSKLFNNVKVGPYAYVRDTVRASDNSKIGYCVEIKKTRLGKNSKVPHLSYVGDTTVGVGVNIGGGVITANYDGVNKHKTIIEDGAFIGVNCSLVAPVNIGHDTVIGASSCIVKNVPDNSLALARSHQVNKVGYYKKQV